MNGTSRGALRRPDRRRPIPKAPGIGPPTRRAPPARPPAVGAAPRRARAGYVVAHELRTPLTSVVLASRILLGADLDEASRRDVAGELAREAQRLADAVEDLLVLAGLDATAHEVEPVSLGTCVRSELERAARLAGRLRVRSLLPGDVGPVTAAVGAVRHLVHDVVAAVVDAAGDDGLVEATLVRLADDRIRLRVRGRVRGRAHPPAGDPGHAPSSAGPAPGVPRAPLRHVAIRVLAERVGATLAVRPTVSGLAVEISLPRHPGPATPPGDGAATPV